MIKINCLLFLHPISNQSVTMIKAAFSKEIHVIEATWDSLYEKISASHRYLIFLDFHSKNKHVRSLIRHLNIHGNGYIAVYNSPLTVTTSDLARFGLLRGFFYHHSTEKKIFNGTKRIISGKYDLPENITEQLFNYYQSYTVKHEAPYYLSLTVREKNVLHHLTKGMSNIEIADSLFISEHTVKSHLYQIFKKIKVKNRNQATTWAYKYLP